MHILLQRYDDDRVSERIMKVTKNVIMLIISLIIADDHSNFFLSI